MVAADLLYLRYDIAIERRNVGPVDLDEVARGIPQIHLDGPAGQLPDGRVAPSVPDAELFGLLVRGLEVVDVEGEVVPLRRGVLVEEEVELQVPDPQPAHRPGEVGRGNLLHPEEVRVETDRLLQVGGADADVGEPSRPHAYLHRHDGDGLPRRVEVEGRRTLLPAADARLLVAAEWHLELQARRRQVDVDEARLRALR